MHHWLKRALTATPREPTLDRIHALYAAAMIAGLKTSRLLLQQSSLFQS
jgi:hypothetical protein